MSVELSEDFIIKFQDKVNWHWISYQQKLSEDFVREFQDKVNWKYISIKRKSSSEFILEFIDKLDIDEILENQELDQETREYLLLLKG